ncbi:MAG: PQQ-binding-like beta-propeller repeat protein [Planctomycetota bacterium]
MRRSILCLAAFCAAITSNGLRGDWPNFRGPKHDGISTETGFAKSWSGSPKKLWETPIGAAYSSFACVGNRLYTCTTEKKKQALVCLDATNGKTLWRQPIEEQWNDSMGDGARATPTVNDGRVYIMGARGRVVCCDAETGKEIWSASHDKVPQWGYSGSVLVEGDLAIYSPGAKAGALRAVNKKTGVQVWTCGKDEAGYCTPYPFEFDGKRYVCGFVGNHAIIADIKSGREVLSIPWETDWKVNAAAPIFHEGHLLLSSGYRTGAGLFRLRADGDKLKSEQVWKNKNMMNKFQSPVLVDGKLYVSDEKGLKCVDYMTGDLKWERRRVANGTIIIADGQMILMTEKGALEIGPIGPGEFKPAASAKILGKCWTVPVLHEGRLYARDMETVVCIDLRAK